MQLDRSTESWGYHPLLWQKTHSFCQKWHIIIVEKGAVKLFLPWNKVFLWSSGTGKITSLGMDIVSASSSSSVHWATTIIKWIIFVAYGACWVCLCCQNPPNSDMDYRIFIMRTDVNACDCTWGCTDTERESVLRVDSGKKIPCCTMESNLC